MFDDVVQAVEDLSIRRLTPEQERKLYLKLEAWVKSHKLLPHAEAIYLADCQAFSKKCLFRLTSVPSKPVVMEPDPTKSSDARCWKVYPYLVSGSLSLNAMPNAELELYAATQ